ncbi:Hypothetical protein CKL_3259 [Clostridium kluyveri DSM 555]|uniref:Uncharacterized protein n=1 Tax=Clostridium kluyveri (strain ATCC 8527 / DSM 555 / NBRC 12016 / NCIMB 10680 / K1) TaxID=431943 RepID=A5N2B6_CLOK5|nr:Hypothetical protein CKL_3259 [Clostridium kluyveri DSM 555]
MVSTKGVTIRFSDELHTAMKLKTVKEQITIQDYIIKLVKNDLRFNEKNSK